MRKSPDPPPMTSIAQLVFPPRRSTRLRAESLLSVLVPSELGGPGVTVGQVADIVFELGRHCASTAMIYAMHQIQVASLVRHGRSAFFRDYLADLGERQLLLAVGDDRSRSRW